MPLGGNVCNYWMIMGSGYFDQHEWQFLELKQTSNEFIRSNRVKMRVPKVRDGQAFPSIELCIQFAERSAPRQVRRYSWDWQQYCGCRQEVVRSFRLVRIDVIRFRFHAAKFRVRVGPPWENAAYSWAPFSCSCVSMKTPIGIVFCQNGSFVENATQRWNSSKLSSIFIDQVSSVSFRGDSRFVWNHLCYFKGMMKT